jgi:ribose transport system substrate-binding protein
LRQLCPSCTATVDNLPFTQINTEEQVALSILQGNPQTNFIVPVYDFELASIAPAVTEAHDVGKVKLASFNALPSILQMMAKPGSSVQADVGSPNDWFGYSIADQVLRVLTGTAPVPSENNPLRLFVPSDITSLDLSQESPDWYGNVDYVAGYQKLWGPPAQ